MLNEHVAHIGDHHALFLPLLQILVKLLVCVGDLREDCKHVLQELLGVGNVEGASGNWLLKDLFKESGRREREREGGEPKTQSQLVGFEESRPPFLEYQGPRRSLLQCRQTRR